MRRFLRALATAVAVVVAILWIALGRNPGWTKTSVAIQKTDPVTGLDYREYQKRFVPGLELLGLGFAGAGLLWGLSFVFRCPQPPVNPTNQSN